ncbi:tyrosine-type recombinase/integrase, partial [Alistipes shahii]
YRGYPGKIDETRVFPVKDRKSMCTTIKRIAQKCGITKNLSTHIGRHTFGTTVTLEKGVPIETVSEMLGHKQITTTQIYAKLTANKMKEDVRLLTQRIGNLYELTQPTTRLLSKEA